MTRTTTQVCFAALALTSAPVVAQFTITDDVFLETLQYTVPNALNGNVLDTLHPDVLACTSLLPSNFLAVNDPCYNIDGIRFFTNLETLGLRYASIGDLTGLPNTIRTLDLDYIESAFQSIDRWPDSLRHLTIRHDWYWNGGNNWMEPLPPFPSHLEHLDLNGQSVDSLPPLPASLRYLDVYRCTFVILPELPNGLQYLDAGHNTPLTQLIDIPDSLTFLNISSDVVLDTLGALPEGLIELRAGFVWALPADVPALPSTLEILQITGAALVSTLPELPDGLRELYLGTMANVTALPDLPPALEVLQLTSLAGITALEPLPPALLDLRAASMSGLTSLPSLPSTLQKLNTEGTALQCYPYVPPSVTEWDLSASCVPNMPPNLIASSNAIGLPVCNLISTPDCPTFEAAVGRIFLDEDGDGAFDAGEPPFMLAQVGGEPGGYLAGAGSNGRYVLPLAIGTFTVDGTDVTYFERTTAPHGVTITEPFGVDSLNDIGYQLIPGTVDVHMMVSMGPARPGFQQTVWVQVQNLGTQPADGSITFTFDPLLEWTGSSLAPTTLNANTAQWDFSFLVPGALWSATITLQVPVGVPIGTSLTYSGTVTPTVGDADETNNTALVQPDVVGSFDPNDKRVEPSTMDLVSLAMGQRLDYLIRFQNTGTYLAERVVITDTLSADLQWSTFLFVSSSHPCSWFVHDGVVHFVFDDILLPDSATDEMGSHGFARFTILPSPALTAGATVNNVANIYFDFNTPVITEPAILTIETSTSVAATGEGDDRLFPVPTSGLLYVRHGAEWAGATAQLFDALGQVVLTVRLQATPSTLDLAALPKGLYTLRSEREGRSWSGRVIKE